MSGGKVILAARIRALKGEGRDIVDILVPVRDWIQEKGVKEFTLMAVLKEELGLSVVQLHEVWAWFEGIRSDSEIRRSVPLAADGS
ncbi:hypothetical protein ACQEU5_07970 [Marinactinospora thermotolerans]|uniref:hypothetical protein n=1 Tax=Marinactinospora thermotolerans TaxID=531310 RepID=UPI003D8A73F9